jgi:hypothetical protein
VPVIGCLVIRNTAGDDTNFKRNIRRAELLQSRDAYNKVVIDVVPPIFDPELLPAPTGKLLLRGIELGPRTYTDKPADIYEFVQLWLCTPLAG